MTPKQRRHEQIKARIEREAENQHIGAAMKSCLGFDEKELARALRRDRVVSSRAKK